MSEATDRPTDDDAWAKACAEDLAAEKERLRGQEQAAAGGTGTAAEELFKLFEAVADKVSGLNNPLLGVAAQGAVRQFVDQAKTAAKPVIERNPEVFDHLAAAGSNSSPPTARPSRATSAAGRGANPGPRQASHDRDPRDDGPDDGPSERIDLD